MSDLKVNEIKTDAVKNVAGTTAATVDSTGALTLAKNISQTDLQWWSGFHDTATTYSPQYATVSNWTKHQGNGITEADGVWTIPVAGVYIFELSLLLQTSGGGVYWNYAPSGGSYTRKWRILYGEPPNASVSNWQNCSGTVMHQFAANDTLKFTVQSTATNFYGANSSNSVSSMMIFKVG